MTNGSLMQEIINVIDKYARLQLVSVFITCMKVLFFLESVFWLAQFWVILIFIWAEEKSKNCKINLLFAFLKFIFRKSKQLAQNYALKWKSHLRHNQFESNQNGRGNQKKPIKLLCCYTSKQNRNTASIQRKLGRGESESSSMFVPELNFGKNPAHVYCSKCRASLLFTNSLKIRQKSE